MEYVNRDWDNDYDSSPAFVFLVCGFAVLLLLFKFDHDKNKKSVL